MPKESDPQGKYGAGLTNLEYAFIAEEMGKTLMGSEVRLLRCLLYIECNRIDFSAIKVFQLKWKIHPEFVVVIADIIIQ